MIISTVTKARRAIPSIYMRGTTHALLRCCSGLFVDTCTLKSGTPARRGVGTRGYAYIHSTHSVTQAGRDSFLLKCLWHGPHGHYSRLGRQFYDSVL
jgi:hypothetical protein